MQTASLRVPGRRRTGLVLALAMLLSTALLGHTSLATAATATISVTPATGTFQVGDTFLLTVQLNAGQPYLGANARITLSPNLEIVAPTSLFTSCTQTAMLLAGAHVEGTVGGPSATDMQVFFSIQPFPATGLPAGSFSAFSGAPCSAFSVLVRALAPGAAQATVAGSFSSPAGGFLNATLTGGAYTIVPAPRTGTISFYPFSGTHRLNETFQTTLYLSGNGQLFTHATGTVSIPNPNLQVVGILPGTCGVSVTTLSFDVTLSTPTASCQLYTLVLQVHNNRINLPGQVSITNGHVFNAAGQDILKSTMDAVFTLTP